MTIERMMTILEELKEYCEMTECRKCMLRNDDDRCNLMKHEPQDYELKYIGDFMIFEGCEE